jgi:hypothetical protein
MERLPITGETLDKSIHEVLEKENLPIGDLENEIVEEIVNSFPKTPTGLSFARWCKYTVNDLIKKIPADRYEDAHRIKMTIGKEIRYILEKDEFDKTTELIGEQKPRWISPSWFFRNAKSFFQAVNAGYRTTHGEVDWKFVTDKLGISDRFKFPEEDDFAEKAKECAQQVLDLLEKNRPEKFNASWIKKQDVNLAARILNQPFRDEEGSVDWSAIISLLPEEWKNRWESQRNMSIERVAYDIKNLDEKYNPSKINQNWLVKHDASLVQYVTENIRNAETNTVDWERVLEILPQTIKDKWSSRRLEWTTEDAIKDIRELLQKENPSTLNPTWIAKKNDGAYRTIVKAIESGTYASWEDVVSKEIPEWKERYGLKHRQVAEKWHGLLEEVLERQQPDTFSPAWIQGQDASLYAAITARFRDEKGEVDWSTFINDLPSKWKERFEQRRTVWTPETAQQALNNFLKEEQPETWNVAWIKAHDTSLYMYLLRRVARSEGELDWQKVISNVDAPFAKRWMTQRYWNIELVKDSLLNTLEMNRPDTFSPVWIQNEFGGMHAFISNTYRNDTDEIDWEYVIEQLPEEWQERWEYKKSRWNPERAHAELLTLLEKENPDYFHPLWITSHNRKLSGYILRHFRNEEGIDWKRLLDYLPIEWQERWRIFPNIPNPEEVKAELADLLNEQNPKYFSPTWIAEHNNSLYQRITRMFRNEKGFVDWDAVNNALPEEDRAKWSKQRTYEESVPDKTYENAEQVKDALGSYSDKLYTFYGAVDPEDENIRNEICDILVRLSQKGNLSAEKLLVDNMTYVAFNWIEEKETLRNIRYHMAEIPELIRKAVYRFNADHAARKTPFAGYLFAQLKIAAQYKYGEDLSIHRSLDDDGSTLEEKLGKYDDEDDVYMAGDRL